MIFWGNINVINNYNLFKNIFLKYVKSVTFEVVKLSRGVFHKDLSALRVVLKVKIYKIQNKISLVDYTQCAASARDLSNAITRHKPRAT